MNCDVNKNSIIVATHINYWERQRGAHQRIFELISSLVSCGYEITVFYTGPAHLLNEKSESLCALVTPEMVVPNIGVALRWALRLRGWGDEFFQKIRTKYYSSEKRPDGVRGWNEFISEYDRHAFRTLIAEKLPSIVVVEYIWPVRLITGLPRSVRNSILAAVDTHDVNHLRLRQFMDQGRLPEQGAVEQEEREALKAFDLIVAIQENDAKVFRAMLPEKRVITVMHSHTVYPPARLSSNTCCNVLFVGANNGPNIDALRDFLQYVWPRIFDIEGDKVQLNVVGSVCDDFSQFPAGNGVIFHGLVDDINEYYFQNDIVVAPLKYGSGLKIKVVEALCHSKPLITTSVGAEGIEDGGNVNFIVADDWEGFYTKCIDLINSEKLRSQYSELANQFAMNNFSQDIVYRELLDYFESASKQ